METAREMNLSFKAKMLKSWTLLNDKVIYGDREILFNEIQSVKVNFKSSFVSNGVIQIIVDNKVITLAYPNKSKEDGERAILYLQENYGGKEQLLNRTSENDIQAEINSLPCKDNWGTRKEIAELPAVIGTDEHIKAITSGLTDGNTWLIVCTNKRVLMLDKGMIYGLKLIDIPLDRINSISHSKGLLLGKISITDGATTRTIQNVSNTTVSFFANTVNKEIELYKQTKITTLTQVVNTTSDADELLKYKQLLDIGVLTQEEFDAKKKQLLNL
ncbi:PH domain-containing protein [Clostridium gasigenes]|uniref:PH domain-containing protein n=1 Tax=Clostridium gasigenes TaxID=94869 RepID=UPI00209B00AD|nr:PH domain-containing protein [Clostridium gasigenes]